METVSGKSENGTLIISLCNSISSANAPQVQQIVDELCADNPHSAVVIDAENLEYISSAGLRIILRLLQKGSELKLINASAGVYDILEMTGFTEMMSVEKAFRRLSVDGCEVIGQGANGVVYRLDDDTIIKVYRNPDSLPDIKRERELARKAFVLGIPTAIPYDVVKTDGGYGSVFELLNAKSFAKLLKSAPEKLDTYVSHYVEVLKKLHGTEVKPEDMPDMKQTALKWLEFLKNHLPQSQYDKLEALLTAIPERMTIIHGDYHVKNIMLQNDEVLLIDMDTLSFGNPVFEFAQMYLAYVGFGELDRSKITDFLDLPSETVDEFWAKTLYAYFGTHDEATIASVLDKIKLIAYIRFLRRNIRIGGLETEEGKANIALCKSNIERLCQTVESLAL